MGVKFEVVTAEVRELDAESAPDFAPVDLAIANAQMKAEAVAKASPEHWVLGADTVVALDGRIYGKPASLDQAREFLRALSGREHQVITGCALVNPSREVELFHEVTRVTFLTLTDEVIERYLGEVSVLDKAGAYALQERGEWIIERVVGSRTNVIGLPTEHLEEVLRTHQIL